MEIENRKIRYDYFVDERLECGIELRGNEVKSIRDGMASIKEAWAQVQDGRLVLRGMHITRWDKANAFDVDEDRERNLLAHKKEILKLASQIQRDGVTLVPSRVYLKNGRVKVEVCVCRGKHNYDKRDSIKNAQVKRDIARAFKSENGR